MDENWVGKMGANLVGCSAWKLAVKTVSNWVALMVSNWVETKAHWWVVRKVGLRAGRLA